MTSAAKTNKENAQRTHLNDALHRFQGFESKWIETVDRELRVERELGVSETYRKTSPTPSRIPSSRLSPTLYIMPKLLHLCEDAPAPPETHNPVSTLSSVMKLIDEDPDAKVFLDEPVPPLVQQGPWSQSRANIKVSSLNCWGLYNLTYLLCQ